MSKRRTQVMLTVELLEPRTYLSELGVSLRIESAVLDQAGDALAIAVFRAEATAQPVTADLGSRVTLDVNGPLDASDLIVAAVSESGQLVALGALNGGVATLYGTQLVVQRIAVDGQPAPSHLAIDLVTGVVRPSGNPPSFADGDVRGPSGGGTGVDGHGSVIVQPGGTGDTPPASLDESAPVGQAPFRFPVPLGAVSVVWILGGGNAGSGSGQSTPPPTTPIVPPAGEPPVVVPDVVEVPRVGDGEFSTPAPSAMRGAVRTTVSSNLQRVVSLVPDWITYAAPSRWVEAARDSLGAQRSALPEESGLLGATDHDSTDLPASVLLHRPVKMLVFMRREPGIEGSALGDWQQQVAMYDFAAGQLAQAGQAARAPLAVLDGSVAFLSSETAQGVDLDGDGFVGNHVLRIFEPGSGSVRAARPALRTWVVQNGPGTEADQGAGTSRLALRHERTVYVLPSDPAPPDASSRLNRMVAESFADRRRIWMPLAALLNRQPLVLRSDHVTLDVFEVSETVELPGERVIEGGASEAEAAPAESGD